MRPATASDTPPDLAAQESSVALSRLRRRYAVPHLLRVDEVGSLSYDSRYADLFFEVLTRRYEANRPILPSTNTPFAEWNEVFPHAACLVTLVDRLIYRAGAHRGRGAELPAEGSQGAQRSALEAAQGQVCE